MQTRWAPDSSRQLPIDQVPVYSDDAELAAVEKETCDLSSAAFAGEARCLTKDLPRLRLGALSSCRAGIAPKVSPSTARTPFAISFACSCDGGGADLRRSRPVVKIRTHRGAVREAALGADGNADGMELPSYRGDIINDIAFTDEAPTPDPRRLLKAYRQSAATLNLLRAFSQGGYADLDRVHQWTLGFVKDSPAGNRYEEIGGPHLRDAELHARLRGDIGNSERLRTTDFYTSHEALLLGYEEAFVRIDFDQRQPLRDIGPFPFGRRPHAPAGSCPCRLPARHQDSDRREVRAEHRAVGVACSSTSESGATDPAA